VGLTIQYEYFGVPHNYEPDFLVRLKNGVTLLLEIKGQEDNRDRAKHDAAQRWVTAGNNWGKQGIWALHVCRNPNVLEQELEYILQSSKAQIIEK
jgi:type III restriction enzyme